MLPIEPSVLIGAGCFFGGIAAGFFGAKAKQPTWEGVHGTHGIEKSDKTSGALHISEEGLEKVASIETLLKDDFLTKDKHTDLCSGQQAEMRLYISAELKAHTKEILTAIKNNGNGHSAGQSGKYGG